MKKLLLAAALLISSTASFADRATWEAKGKPLDICYAVQNNVKFFYNVWANDAKETYAEVKEFMKTTLGGKGPEEAKLLAVYEGVLPKIESGELLPPKMETRYVGNKKAQELAGIACFQAFDPK